MTIIIASSGYHNLKHDKKSSYMARFACQFGRYEFTSLPFRMAPADHMFQQKIWKIFKDLPTVFSIADGILIIG